MPANNPLPDNMAHQVKKVRSDELRTSPFRRSRQIYAAKGLCLLNTEVREEACKNATPFIAWFNETKNGEGKPSPGTSGEKPSSGTSNGVDTKSDSRHEYDTEE